MPLSLTKTGARHAVDVASCDRLPAGQQYVLLPLPGAPPYCCPHPCGGACRFVSAMPAPPPLPPALVLDLRLAPTLAGLVTDALDRAAKPGQAPAEEAHGGPAAYGSLRYYRN